MKQERGVTLSVRVENLSPGTGLSLRRRLGAERFCLHGVNPLKMNAQNGNLSKIDA
jgi:hypothetical protein